MRKNPCGVSGLNQLNGMRHYVDSEDPAGRGVRVVFNGFRKIAYRPGFHGEAILAICLWTIGVISLTTGAEKLSVTAYSDESYNFWWPGAVIRRYRRNRRLTLDPATRARWLV
jgi:hypothetical protein